MPVQEAYQPKPMSASGVVFTGAKAIAGFLCTTSGTVQVRETSASGAIIVNAMAATAGVWHPMPFAFGNGAYAELAGGAVGTFGIF